MAVINTVISLYYYLRVIAPTVLEDGVTPAKLRVADAPLAVALALTTAATVGFGVVAEPLLRLADNARMLTGG